MGRQMQRWAAVAVLAAGLVVGACGGGGSDKAKSSENGQPRADKTALVTPNGPKVEVTAKEFGFTPSTLTMKAGEPTTVVFVNNGSIEHDFTVSDAGFKLAVPAGQTGQKVLTIPKPGTYQFHCSVPGHEGAGMKGTITVA